MKPWAGGARPDGCAARADARRRPPAGVAVAQRTGAAPVRRDAVRLSRSWGSMPQWRRVRRQVLERDGNLCQLPYEAAQDARRNATTATADYDRDSRSAPTTTTRPCWSPRAATATAR